MTALLNSTDLVDPRDVDLFRFVGPGTLNRWCREGRLKTIKVGRKYLTTLAWVKEFMEFQPQPTAKRPKPVRTILSVELPSPATPVQEETQVDPQAAEAITEARQASINAAMASVLGVESEAPAKPRKRARA